ncbi:3,4-dihydroxy-2-butanone-4-phosphate synthase [Azospirillum picis]|uniref:3,4-dihydroxy-2-butanone 4-phosphate synthase n=1 Tax=Azospirillum picis TaxID=488438 RepID=A0ABU0MLK4_9PROT|nr:3,4-dihydroxy-2-butanone-4-phosphate synthase [Azospirillum picis]MBP2300312.1 3,4-dihydroxy 2-butanone 4-phosphate synthase [Azospirillum picis]MDQ0534108.1 3,4-dihydroxy 2-butanone 4-phosphate synthase [Azospirillum picis]
MNQTDTQHTTQPTTQDSLLSRFGTPDERVARALDRIRQGGGVIVVDDDDRENEGDIIYPADAITVEQMALMIRTCSGIVCLILPDDRLRQLDLPPMVAANSARFGTAFTVSIEAREGVTTGVSAADRVTTIRTAIADGCRPEDLARPGHVFPIRANPGGLAVRRGHTEATLDLMRRAGRKPAGVLCEVMNPDGTMARLPELVAFALEQGMPVVSIADLAGDHRLRTVA